MAEQNTTEQKTTKQMHKGHRSRMRERIENNGIVNLQEHEVLEYLLYSFVPRKDTNALAHRLLDEFGSLCDVMNADPKHLKSVSGMTDNASQFIATMPEIFRQYVVCAKHKKDKPVLGSPDQVKNHMGSYFIGLNEERVFAVALDAIGRVISEKEWKSGQRDGVSVEPKDILAFAQMTKAVNVVVAHNHPSGSLSPSPADLALTEKIKSVLELTGYCLQDSLIFNDSGECYSWRLNGKFGDAEADMLVARRYLKDFDD